MLMCFGFWRDFLVFVRHRHGLAYGRIQYPVPNESGPQVLPFLFSSRRRHQAPGVRISGSLPRNFPALFFFVERRARRRHDDKRRPVVLFFVLLLQKRKANFWTTG